MGKKRYDVAVIGGGPGGYTAALYCARNGFSVVVLERLSAGGQMATTEQIDNYPGFEDGVDGFELGEKMLKGAERFGVETLYAEVTGVDFSGSTKRIESSEGVIEARTVVLATGASARELGVKDERNLRGRGVAYCATCDGMMYRDKTVVVVGGGNTAVGDALYLAKICKKVYLVHRRDSLRATPIYIDALRENNVELVWNSRISQFQYDKRLTGVRIENVQTGETRDIACEGVFVAVGRVPDTKVFADQVRTDDNGYLIADETTRTNVPGVFAVGDARTKEVRQIVTAAADGAVAAHYVEEYLLERSAKAKEARF